MFWFVCFVVERMSWREIEEWSSYELELIICDLGRGEIGSVGEGVGTWLCLSMGGWVLLMGFVFLVLCRLLCEGDDGRILDRSK